MQEVEATDRQAEPGGSNVEELSDTDLELIVGGGGTEAPLMYQALTRNESVKARDPKLDGVVILHSSLPGGDP